MNKLSLIGLVLVAVVLLLGNVLYTVDQTQTAIILQFGEPVGLREKPGLYAKMPFIQDVIRLDNRLMEYDVATTIIYTRDQKNMVVDAYVRWRITNPLLFYMRFKSDNSFTIIEDAKRRLGDVIIGVLKAELGNHTMTEIISQSRDTIMESITQVSNNRLSEGGESSAPGALDTSGLAVIDTRIKRADLPPENQRSIFERMKTAREEQATLYRSEGLMEGRRIRADADREREFILAEAQRLSQEIQGEADAQAAAIYAEAFSLAPEFYSFTRSLESYQTAFRHQSTLVLSPEDIDYLKYFGKMTDRPSGD